MSQLLRETADRVQHVLVAKLLKLCDNSKNKISKISYRDFDKSKSKVIPVQAVEALRVVRG
jgi:hypothetical protein